jgi:hypothetical protein
MNAASPAIPGTCRFRARNFLRFSGTNLTFGSSRAKIFLIHSGELDPAFPASDYFDHLINADDWLRS